jgi:DNA-binding transcriptional regulator YdaS (Cro superfamily)
MRSTTPTPKHRAVAEAIRRAGGQSALAKAIGVSQPTVSEWLNGKKPVIAEKAPDIEALTGVPAERLHPAFARLKKLRAQQGRAA